MSICDSSKDEASPSSFNKDEIDIVIYHHPCKDGFGSAYVVWKYYKNTKNTRDIEYIGVSYGSKLPDIKDKNVIICDYSYPLSIMKEIQRDSKSVLVIDHHKTAQQELESIDESCKIFDMDHSGAVLTWKYFYGDDEIPMMLLYIEDHDIWKKELPDTDAFSSWFETIDLEFDLYDNICTNHDEFRNGIEIGKSYIQLNNINKVKIATKSAPKLIEFRNRGTVEYKMVAHVNSGLLASDVGNCAFDVHPFIDLSAVYSVKDYSNTTTFSLRSTNYHTDVGTLSKKYLGGGGHRNASGAMIPAITTCLSGKVYDIDIYNVIKDGISFKTDGHIKTPIAYLNTTHNPSVLCKYLMQPKFVFEGEEISTIRSIKALLETLRSGEEDGRDERDEKDEGSEKDEKVDCTKVDWTEGSDFLTKYQENLRSSVPIELVGIWSYKCNRTHYKVAYTNKGKKILNNLMGIHMSVGAVSDYVEETSDDGSGICSFKFSERLGVRPRLDIF